MLPESPRSVWVYVKRISVDEARDIIRSWKDDIKSIVGHQATAEILSILLNMKIEVNRVEVKLGYKIVMCQDTRPYLEKCPG
jgi:hypothetical protein